MQLEWCRSPSDLVEAYTDKFQYDMERASIDLTPPFLSNGLLYGAVHHPKI